jgi:DNA polymerase III delta prime subunit
MSKMKWRTKYAPKVWTELLLPKDKILRSTVSDLFNYGDCGFDGFLLYGSGGSGKTTFAEMLEDHTGWDIYELNASGECKKDLDDLKTVCHLIPGGEDKGLGHKNLILGNEISESSGDFRRGLRDIIDKSLDTFFIFTDNNYDKLKAENAQLFDDERILAFCWDDLDHIEFIDVCNKILLAEGFSPIKNSVLVTALVTRCHPSIRKTINELQFNKSRLLI